MTAITSRHHPIVDAFRELVTTPDPAGRRLLLDGVHLVREAFDTGLDIELAVLATDLPRDSEEAAVAERLADAGVEVRTASASVIKAMSPVRTPSGIVAIARRPPATVAGIIEPDNALVLVAVDVQDPGNIGGLVRSAEAAGASGVIVCGASANPFGSKALRGSMGSALRLPIVAGVAPEAAISTLRAAHVQLVAAVPRGGDDPDDLGWEGRVAVLIGGEGPGLSPQLAAACDRRVTIPMAAQVESLNVAVAGAVLLYAARRRRLTAISR